MVLVVSSQYAPPTLLPVLHILAPHRTGEAAAPAEPTTEVAADADVAVVVVGAVVIVLGMVYFSDKVVLHVATVVRVTAHPRTSKIVLITW